MGTSISKQESLIMQDIKRRLLQVRTHLVNNEIPPLEDTSAWYSYLATLKTIQGNFNNDVSFLALVRRGSLTPP